MRDIIFTQNAWESQAEHKLSAILFSEAICDTKPGPNRFLTCKRYSSPVIGLEWPRGFQEVKVPRFDDNGTGWW